MPYRDKNLNKEVRWKLRQFYRLILSYGDFKQAHYISSYILLNKLHDSEDRRLLEALNCAMIISYCRPFSGNDRSFDSKIPDLPSSLLKNLTDDEKEIHEIALADRNTLLAHSDSCAHDLQPEVWTIKDTKILMPVKNDTRAPLTKEATEVFQSLSGKMRDVVFNERMQLEPELIDYFQHVSIEEFLKSE